MEHPAVKRPLCEAVEPKESPLNLKGTQFLPTPASTTASTTASNTVDGSTDDRRSPAPSDSDLSSIQDVSSLAPQDTVSVSNPSTTDNPRPTKRRKLTPGEKAERELEKQAKALEKETKRQERDAKKQEQAELKAVRDSEKLVRDVEKQKKAEEREAKKREKELEEERKAQEKLRKERSQMRLGAFFQPPANASPESKIPTSVVMTRRKSLSLEPFEVSQARGGLQSAVKSPAKPAAESMSDYKAYFLPFEIRPHTTMSRLAPLSPQASERAQGAFDGEMQQQPSVEAYDLGLVASQPSLRSWFPKRSRRRCQLSDVRQIFKSTNEAGLSSSADPLLELSAVPMRYIHFTEDVRPPYHGTFTGVRSQQLADDMRINPLLRGRTDTNYDYDSEFEWEEPEEGEDLEGDDEDEESNDDPQEMDEFLDDADDELVSRRKIVVTDLEPDTTGICWQDTRGRHHAKVAAKERELLSTLRIQVLLPNVRQIDPFSTSYWHITKPNELPQDAATRLPLAERSSNTPSKAVTSGWPIHNSEKSSKRGHKAGAQKTMSPTEFDEFKEAVVGSLLSKQELVNKLKTAFPNFMASLIKDTLGERFAQIGKSKADKKWVYVSAA